MSFGYVVRGTLWGSQPKILTDFCPSFIGQKSIKNFVGFLGDLKTPKVHSEINWPLVVTAEAILKISFKLLRIFVNQRSQNALFQIWMNCMKNKFINQKSTYFFAEFAQYHRVHYCIKDDVIKMNFM